jgi:cation diffusion facilitator family transporter
VQNEPNPAGFGVNILVPIQLGGRGRARYRDRSAPAAQLNGRLRRTRHTRERYALIVLSRAVHAFHIDRHVQATHLSVVFFVAVNFGEAVALAAAAWVTGSAALIAQAAANAAELGVGVFLLIGVLRSNRPPDETHPLGYGRERFFWSLFAALAIFVGGAGLAFDQAVGSALDPSPIDSYSIAYLVLAATIALDALTLEVALRPLRRRAVRKGTSVRAEMQRSTDPAVITVIVGGGCAVIGGSIAALGLVLSQTTGSAIPDTLATALIGLLLLAASVLLLRTNRELLTGRGVSRQMLRAMRHIIATQEGVVDVPDLFAVVIGPSSLIVDGDVTFADAMNVPAVEQAIESAAAALRKRWPSIEYIYLTPVHRARSRRAQRSVGRG